MMNFKSLFKFISDKLKKTLNYEKSIPCFNNIPFRLCK
jgi:hypothetical protein